MPWFLRGLSNGTLTTGWPRTPDPYFDAFAAAVGVDDDAAAAEDPGLLQEAASRCPTGAISLEAGRTELDRGRCILCRRCTETAPKVFRPLPGSGVAALSRDGLVAGSIGETEESISLLRKALDAKVRALRRSVHIRHLDAGSDGSDEWEVQALLNPVYDVHRLGIFFTASPRHADILLITGIGTAGMAEAVARTREAMPEPVVVVAAGSDAASGGLIGRGYTSGIGAAALTPVDVWVPGSPASPFSLLHGILLALGRVVPAPGAGRP